MISLGLGMLAALCWGVHDVCVRFVSQRTGIMASILTVLVVGAAIKVPLALWHGGSVSPLGLQTAVLSGVTFAVAGVGLYKALEIGPVRLVAPLIGSYPVLSVGWAAFSGTPITLLQWLAVLAVIAGVGFVAAWSDNEDTQSNRLEAIGWSLLANFTFAASFALGQVATTAGTETAVIALTRIAAIVTILGLALVLRKPLVPGRAQLPLLVMMGCLDGIALGSVMYAGTQANPEFAAVAASTFGLITVILAWLFLREPMRLAQWGGVIVVFAAVGYLGL